MFRNANNQYIPASQYQVVGKVEGTPRKLYHVGYRNGEPIFCVAKSPDQIVLSYAITIAQLLKFNPMGWELDEEKIISLKQKKPNFDKPTTSDLMSEQLERQATASENPPTPAPPSNPPLDVDG